MKHTRFTSILKLSFIAVGLIFLDGCSDDDSTSPQASDSPCVITSSPSYFGTSQTFEYDQAGYLTARKYEFGYPGYSTFIQTVDAEKTSYKYTHGAATIEVTDQFTGGTGNFYEAQPQILIRTERQTFTDGREDITLGPRELMSFQYDDKKRLTSAIYYHDLYTSTVELIYKKQLYSTDLELTYDDNDNVIALKQSQTFREGVYVVQAPETSYFFYYPVVLTAMNVTYDDKPSPYSAILKYWSFVQGDWGYTGNSNWPSIIRAYSKNNPLTITFVTSQSQPVEITNSMTYTYNEQGFPIDSYTYNCK